VIAAWCDFVPALPGPRAEWLGGAADNPPSKISALWLAKWWWVRDCPAHAFALDEIRLGEKIERDTETSQMRQSIIAR
jgi:hypothetical protein